MNKNECKNMINEYNDMLNFIERRGEFSNIKSFCSIAAYNVVNRLDRHLADNKSVSIELSGELKVELFETINDHLTYVVGQVMEREATLYTVDDDKYPLLDYALDTVVIPTIMADVKSFILRYLYKYILENGYDKENIDIGYFIIDEVNKSLIDFKNSISRIFNDIVSMSATNRNNLVEIQSGSTKLLK